MKYIPFCNRVIEYSFYALFFLVPLVFTNSTSELFEFNKMWLTFGLTIIIGAAWIGKMTLERRIFIQRTPLDIPLLLFLLSQVISTLFSLDQRVSVWGYYSRFNGGLLSMLSYVFLFYAFVSNCSIKQTIKLLTVSLVSGIIVGLWGLPSHFGYDPTCLLFRGTFDTSCWTDAFKPTVRIFSTLGQPAWLAAYLAVLIPLATAYVFRYIHKPQVVNPKKHAAKKQNPVTGVLANIQDFFSWKVLLATLITLFFYVNLLYSNTRGGFIAFWIADVVFWSVLFWRKSLSLPRFVRTAVIIHLLFLISTFFSSTPIEQLNILTLGGIQQKLHQSSQPAAQAPTAAASIKPAVSNGELGGTDSGQIRLFVWKGAIDAWKSSPLFGTGVETFAYAYYQFRPAGHNLTSEWDYLYNKAHNEYLNYLATTGLFGLGTYLAFIGMFLWIAIKHIWKNRSSVDNEDLSDEVITARFVEPALIAGFISILISNFFGFSVVIMNLFLFLIPIFYLILSNSLSNKRAVSISFGTPEKNLNPYQWTALALTSIISLIFLFNLLQFWRADVAYALGHNLDQVGEYQQAYPNLTKALQLRGTEPVYKDELSLNEAVLATALLQQKDTTNAGTLASQALALSNDVVENHPNNVVFWKNRVRVMYTLSQANPDYLKSALEAIQKARDLAPTDAKISYNLGVLYGQTGDTNAAIKELERAQSLKPDYKDVYYALGLFYHDKATASKPTNPEYEQKAVDQMQYILSHFDPKDKGALDSLKSWGVK